MTNKEKYREFCEYEKNIPIFSQDWWLDAVCGNDNWDVAIVEKGGQIWATMPYYKVKKFGFTLIIMPKLTQTLGPYIKYPPKQKYSSRLSWEKEVMSKLIEQLPKFDYFNQHFHYTVTNWLPFYWKGFKQTTRYTYIIDLSKSLDEIFSDISSNYRNKIRKASSLVSVERGFAIEEFYKINKKTFERQEIKIPYDLDFVKKQYQALKQRNLCEIFYAVDKHGNIHSSAFLMWDNDSAYVHMIGEDPEFRNSGAGILLIWELIKFSAKELNLKYFNFEGSIIESIEQVRRDFGAIQVPYFKVYKINSFVLYLFEYFREALR
jgi:lipid II:glycine glycyltransferase (peptidoglycan interpeptide bridge formation enzyme)